MKFLQQSPAAMAFIWAGVSLGGNIIAAPAKFQVDTLNLGELLEVGRAQFAWLGWAETGLALGLAIGCICARRFPSWTLYAVWGLFAVQQLYLQPVLEARTDLLGSGADVPESHAHIIFIALEIAKFCCLFATGFLHLKPGPQGAPDS